MSNILLVFFFFFSPLATKIHGTISKKSKICSSSDNSQNTGYGYGFTLNYTANLQQLAFSWTAERQD